MQEIKHYNNPNVHNDSVLIIGEDDIIKNENQFKMKRFNWIFIHKNNKYKDDFKRLTEPSRMVLGLEIGKFYEYE